MNKQMFLQLLRQPGKISEDELRDLEKFAEQYPYCQSAHILIAKYYADNGHMLAGLKVKKAALYAADRSNLKRLIEHTETENAEALKKTASFIPENVPETELNKIVPIEEPLVIEKAEKELIQEVPTEIKEELVLKEVEVESETKDTVVQEVKLEDQTKDQLLEELRQSLIALRESRKKAFIQKEAPEDELISKETKSTEYSTPIVEKEPVVEPKLLEESVTKEEPIVQEVKLLTVSLDHYVPESGRGPMPIPFNREYKALEPEETTVLSQYYEYLNQKRQVFKKNKRKEDEIINRLSMEEPVMPKMNAKTLPEETADLSTRSTTLQKGPISENFARILVLQGKSDKAIEIYTELSLKFPEKKAYFDAQIEKLKTKLG